MNITHNVTAMNTYNKMNISQNFSNKSMEKLSSGYKINRGADDAAGLSISEKMRSQIRGLNQASENAEQGVSMIQTAEGALNEDHAILHRIRELAIQAANDTNSRDDRDAIQSEISELINEVNRIANTTEFNGMKLLNGTFSKDNFTETCVKGGNVNLDLSIGVSNEIDLDFVNGITLSTSATINYQSLDTSKDNFIKVFYKDGSLCTSYTFNDTDDNSQTTVNKKLSVNENGDYYYNSNGINFTITKESADKYIKSNPSETYDVFELNLNAASGGVSTFNARKTFNTKNDYCDDSSQNGFIKNLEVDEYSIDRLNFDSIEIIYDNNDYHDKDKLEVYFYKDGEVLVHDSIEGGGNGRGVFLKQYNANGIKFDLEGNSSFESDGRIHAKIDLQNKLGVDTVSARRKVVSNHTETTIDDYLTKSFTDPTVTLKSLSKSISVYEEQKMSFPHGSIKFIADDEGFKITFKDYNGDTHTSLTKVPWKEELPGNYSYTFTANDFPESERAGLSSLNIPFEFSISRDATLDQVKTQFNSSITLSTSPSNNVTATLYPTISGLSTSSSFNMNYNAIIASGKDCSNSDDDFIIGNGFSGGTYVNISSDPTVNKDEAFYFSLTMKDYNGNTIPLRYKLAGVKGNGTNQSAEYYNHYWYHPTSYDIEGNPYENTSIKYNYSFTGANSYNGMLSLISGTNDITIPGGNISLTFELYNDSPINLKDGTVVSSGTKLGTGSYSISIPQGSTEDYLYNILHNLKGCDISDSNPKTNYSIKNSSTDYGTTTIDYKYDKIVVTEDVTYEEIDLYDESNKGLFFHVGANKNQIVESSFNDMSASKLGLTGFGEGYTKEYSVNNGVNKTNIEKGLCVTTRKDANFAISIVDKALDIVSSERSKLGSIQNRLEYTINNLDTSSENMTSSESTIRDVDMASEMMSLTKNQILQQASQAMLTQAMQTPQQVLQLLQ